MGNCGIVFYREQARSHVYRLLPEWFPDEKSVAVRGSPVRLRCQFSAIAGVRPY